jgi:hypothetical protein
VRFLERIADRIHAKGDAAARAQGLTVTRLPGGRRRISHPGLLARLEARRRYAETYGVDPVDRIILDLTASRSRLTCEKARSVHVESALEDTRIAV